MIETASGAMRLLISPSGENTYEVSIHSEVPLEGDVLNALSLFAKDTE